MTTHARKQVRVAVIARVTGLTTTGARVYPGRTRPLTENHDPTLLVYVREERAAADSQGRPIELLRTLSLSIEGRVSSGNPPDDALDQIALEVETAMGADPTLGGVVFDSQLAATRIATDAPGQRQVGAIRLDYTILYRTAENAPGVIV